MPEPLAPNDYLPLVKAALAEDIGSGDVTTQALVPEDSFATAVMVARAAGHGRGRSCPGRV